MRKLIVIGRNDIGNVRNSNAQCQHISLSLSLSLSLSPSDDFAATCSDKDMIIWPVLLGVAIIGWE
jgi:hypothetical protein